MMAQINEEQKSLWRIKEHYLNETDGCEKCEKFWKKMEKDKEDHVNELSELIKEHLC
ncbi:MAG: hypothetical protein GF349_04705 [Candidatus Magasanikbacteria bacterium]|nr:hypothetical protein [Candidatus Magasanikbacteria bacterium]